MITSVITTSGRFCSNCASAEAASAQVRTGGFSRRKAMLMTSRVVSLASMKEKVGLRVAQHLHHAREVVVRQVGAEACVGLGKHLRGLKPLRFADDDLFYMGGDDRGLPVAVDIVVAAGLKCFHQRALTSIAKRDNGQIGVLRVRVNDSCNLQSTHLPHICRAKNYAWRVVFARGESESRLL